MTVRPLLLRVAALLEHLGIDLVFIGGQAVIQLGEPRQLAEVADGPEIVEQFEALLAKYYYPPERTMI